MEADSRCLLAQPREMYFSHEAPRSLYAPDLVTVNERGDIIFAWKVQMVVQLNRTTGEVSIDTTRTISQYHVLSGEKCSYDIDVGLDLQQLQQRCDFYSITDNSLLITFNVELCHLTQFVFVLKPDINLAVCVATRTVTVPFAHSPFVGVGELSDGKVMVTGTRQSSSPNRDFVVRTIAANPHTFNQISEVDYSAQVDDFSNFLLKTCTEREVFIGGIFVVKKELFIMLKSGELLVTNEIGRINLESNMYTVCVLDDTYVTFGGQLSIRCLKQLTGRRNHVWLSIVSPDYDKLASLHWTIRLRLVYVNLIVLTFLLNASIRMRRIDGGWSLSAFMWILKKIYGPSMIPRTQPQKRFFMYYLDLSRFKFVKAQYTPPLFEKEDLQQVEFPTAFECDADGGAIVFDFPRRHSTDICVKYFPRPFAPLPLARIAKHKAYRNYPSFEKSHLLRKFLGVIDCKWTT